MLVVLRIAGLFQWSVGAGVKTWPPAHFYQSAAHAKIKEIIMFVLHAKRFQSASMTLRSQRGYSLIELGIALAILSVIIVGSLIGVQSILRNNRTNDMLKAVPSYLANAVKVTANQTQVNGIATTQLIQLGVFEESKVVEGGDAVVNEHGGRVHLQGSQAAIGTFGAGQLFILTLTNLPREVCADVASGLDSVAYAMHIDSGNATNAGSIPAAANVKQVNTTAIDVAGLATACGQAGAKRITVAVPRS